MTNIVNKPTELLLLILLMLKTQREDLAMPYLRDLQFYDEQDIDTDLVYNTFKEMVKDERQQ